MLLDDERETSAYSEKDRTNPFLDRTASLQVALRVVERVADHFALNHAEPECQEIKEDLLSFERGDTGRIRLADFYRAGLKSRFFYTESKVYLRAMGALDESDLVWGPKVIVSNYVLAKSNCLADSEIYSVCCFNECEGLYRHLEESIAAPEGTSEQIATLVARLSSSTVQAPRNLSQTALLLRLDEIAAGHGGKVLLHSRLFAQWMHQAFPRECPYPHLVGSTTSLGPLAWSEQSGQVYEMEHTQVLDYIDQAALPQANQTTGEDSGADMMWIFEDEHLVEPRSSMVARAKAAASLVGVYIFRLLPFGLVAMLVLLAKVRIFSDEARSKGRSATAVPGRFLGKSEKYFV
jgi:hypothetical protein